MITLSLRYISKDRDRHGKWRYYFRRKGQPKIRLPSDPNTSDFRRAYEAAFAHGNVQTSNIEKPIPGSFRDVCCQYYASPEFKFLHPSTQKWRRRALEKISLKFPSLPIGGMESKHVFKLRNERMDSPSVSTNILKSLKALFKFAISYGLVKNDPTIGVRRIPNHSEGHHMWTEEEVQRFESRHPPTSKAGFALSLLLCTACRRQDVVKLGYQHLSKGRIRYTQQKNVHRRPVHVDLLVHPDLMKLIDERPKSNMTFLTTEYGRPFTANGFGNWFKKRCMEAGLEVCSAHGLRKLAATRLAEAGATAHEIMAVTGHSTLKEVQHYTEAASRPGLADKAVGKLKSRT